MRVLKVAVAGRVAAVVVVLLGLAAGSSGAVAATGAVPGAAGRLEVRARPSAVTLIAVLTGVAATSSRRAWTVGWTDEFSVPSRPVILQWDGTGWKRVRGLRPAKASLQSVAAVSAGDAWAVGFSNGALIMHWAGGKWRRASSPREGTGSKLLGVAAPSARSAWAVGCVRCVTGGGQPLALRWNGTSWRQARLPRTGPASELLGVAASSARNAWAVGCTRCGQSASRTLMLHWNGTAWRIVRLGGTGSAATLSGVAVLSARIAWAVGCRNCQFGGGKSLILRWNGHTWQRSRAPATGFQSRLSGVAVRSARSAWAVGSGGRTGIGAPKTVILRWNGTAWKRVPSPNATLGNGGALVSVVATSGTNAWAVGNNFNDEAQTLIVRWNGKIWKTS